MHSRLLSLGANAVVSIGFDTSEMSGSVTKVLAYGTAVVVEPDTTQAKQFRFTKRQFLIVSDL